MGDLQRIEQSHQRADQVQLERVLDNLLDNALRHTASGGQIRLQAIANRLIVTSKRRLASVSRPWCSCFSRPKPNTTTTSGPISTASKPPISS